MFKSNILISLLLAALAVHQTSSRFLSEQQGRNLQVGNTTTTLTAAQVYRGDLMCGDCILANFIYCVKGTEGMIVDSLPQGYCCKDLASCSYTKNINYTCSSIYNSYIDKMRVCPFLRSQCGPSSNFSLSGTADQSCLKIKNITKGNVCLYKVQASCGYPQFQLNDTSNVLIKAQVTNPADMLITCNMTQQSKINSIVQYLTQKQPCSCYNTSLLNGTRQGWNCSCNNPLNVTQKNLAINGTQCKCNMIYSNPQKACNCCVSLPPVLTCPSNVSTLEQCSCTNNTNNKALEKSLNCTCYHPQNPVFGVVNTTSISSSCLCNEWTTATLGGCGCCLSLNISKNQSTQCPNNQTRQSCKCAFTNSSSLGSCNCTVQNNDVAFGLPINQSYCSCNSTTKACNCCLSLTDFILPNCTNNQTNLTSAVCSCDIPKTAEQLLNCACLKANTQNSYLTPAQLNQTVCRYNQYRSSYQCCAESSIFDIPVLYCPVSLAQANCTCKNVTNAQTKTSSWSCSCVNDTNQLTAKNLSVSSNQCLCNTTTATPNCSCCVQLIAIPVINCDNSFIKQNCQCSNTTNSATKLWQWTCTCNNSVTNVTKGLNYNQSGCLCNEYGCQCCQALPPQPIVPLTCGLNSTLLNCSCTQKVNTTTNQTQLYCNCTNKNVTAVINQPLNNCTCSNNSTTNCSCCVQVAQNTTSNTTTNTTNNTTTNQTCDKNSTQRTCTCQNLTTNTTTKQWSWFCGCSSGNLMWSNVTVPQARCQCQNSSCSCCIPNNTVSYIRPPASCDKNSTIKSCLCKNITSNQTYSCNCSNTSSNNLNFKQPNCSCYGANCSCCVMNKYIVVPPASNNTNTTNNSSNACSANSLRQNCSCSNITNSTNKLCKCFVNATANATNLTLSQANCTCNGTKCSCCVINNNNTQPPINQFQCNKTQSGYNCTCSNVTNSTNGNLTCNCSTSLTKISIPQAQCLCNKTNFCNCCLATTSNTTNTTNTTGNNSTNTTIPPTGSDCSANTVRRNCSCLKVGFGTWNATKPPTSWAWGCNCSDNTLNVTTVGFQFVQSKCQCNGTNCSCCVDSNPQLQCSKYQDQQNCTCKNVIKANGNYSSWQYSCSCVNNTNTTLKRFNTSYAYSQCLGNSSNYGCCLVRPQPLNTPPKCQANFAVEYCGGCINLTSSDPYQPQQVKCNCTKESNYAWMQQPTFNVSQCIVTNNKTYYQLSCCLPLITTPPEALGTCAYGKSLQYCFDCADYKDPASQQQLMQCNCSKAITGLNPTNQRTPYSDCQATYNNPQCCVKDPIPVYPLNCTLGFSQQSCTNCSLKYNNQTGKQQVYCMCTVKDQQGYQPVWTNQSQCSSNVSFVSDTPCCVQYMPQSQIDYLNSIFRCSATEQMTYCSSCQNVLTSKNTTQFQCNCIDLMSDGTVIQGTYPFINPSKCKLLNGTTGQYQCCMDTVKATSPTPKACGNNFVNGDCACQSVFDFKTNLEYQQCDFCNYIPPDQADQTSQSARKTIKDIKVHPDACNCLDMNTGQYWKKCDCCVPQNFINTYRNYSCANYLSYNCSCLNVTIDNKTKAYDMRCNCTASNGQQKTNVSLFKDMTVFQCNGANTKVNNQSVWNYQCCIPMNKVEQVPDFDMNEYVCDATTPRPASPNITCNSTYEMTVAIIGLETNSSVLMQLNSYQLKLNAHTLLLSLAAALLLTLALFTF